MTSWDEIRSQHRHVQQSVRVPMRADLIDQIQQLEQAAKREAAIDEQENRMPLAPAIAAKIREVEAEVAESAVTFTFRGVGRRGYAALLAEHPPTPQQAADAAEHGQRVLYDPATFIPALMAAACITPEDTTLEDMVDVCDNWSEGQFSQMWSACIVANMGSADAGPKSQIASEILRESGPSLTTADL